MTNRVFYHYPRNTQYSLAYVTPDKDSIATSGDVIIERYSFDDEFYVLYTNRGASGTVDNLEDEFDGVLDAMTFESRIISLRLLQIFEGIIREKQIEGGEKLKIYKQIELEKIPDAIERVNWSMPAVDVAGEIMSTLVLKHALPNANHRTSISMAEWYLESSDAGFSLPELATQDYRWREWVGSYITESKRLLTVRRNTTAFSLLQQWGCDIVERKGNIAIDLSEYELELDRSDALEHYAELHTELCSDFMVESVSRAGSDELTRMEGPTKTAFVDYLDQAE